jgi:hypothetical protein
MVAEHVVIHIKIIPIFIIFSEQIGYENKQKIWLSQ